VSPLCSELACQLGRVSPRTAAMARRYTGPWEALYNNQAFSSHLARCWRRRRACASLPVKRLAILCPPTRQDTQLACLGALGDFSKFSAAASMACRASGSSIPSAMARASAARSRRCSGVPNFRGIGSLAQSTTAESKRGLKKSKRVRGADNPELQPAPSARVAAGARRAALPGQFVKKKPTTHKRSGSARVAGLSAIRVSRA
jgi:hypothetical protein